MGVPEIIDLTGPEVIELDSDGEVVDARPPTNDASVATAETTQLDITPHKEQAKKKRKKRKRKPSAVAQSEHSGAASAQPIPPRNEPETPENNADMEPGQIEDEKGQSPGEQHAAHAGGSSRGVINGGEHKRELQLKERQRDPRGRGRYERDKKEQRERRRSRSPHRGHDKDRDARRRSRSRARNGERQLRNREFELDSSLFFEDLTPAEVPAAVKLSTSIAGSSRSPAQNTNSATTSQATFDLLLPTHVSIAAGAEDEALDMGPLPAPEIDSDEDYIDYLDYGDTLKPGIVRYWELEKLEAATAKASKPTRVVCKKCGAEGEHKTNECTVLICLTCGARNEHPTRSCPISKVCFACGMKGHINKTCPNRGTSGAYSGFNDCDRCGARTHQTNECPTLWRMYKYVEDEDRQEILLRREAKRALAFGQGGEGYIANDEWCYNCGQCGHFGDDCEIAAHVFDKPPEPSAFSLYNILSGPFASDVPRVSKRSPRDWETASAFADGYGATLPVDVGRQSRRKERDRLMKVQQLQDAEYDEDWFDGAHSRARNGREHRNIREDSHRAGGKAHGKVKFNFSSGTSFSEREGKRQRTSFDDPPRFSNETDAFQIRGAAHKRSHMSSKDRRDRGYERSRNRYEEPQRGPRYRGGYR